MNIQIFGTKKCNDTKKAETSEEAVVREVLEETGIKMEVDRLGFIHENYFYGDAESNLGKLIYEVSYFYYMKVPDDFEPVCMSMTEDDHEEFLRWIDIDDPIKYYPEFFRTELLHPEDGVKHFVTDERCQKCNGDKEKHAAERATGDRKVTIEELLEKPYWIIDILPKRVPKDSPGQYFAIEDFFLKEQLTEIKKKHIDVILKLNCYMDISIDGEKNPAPGRIRDIMMERYVYIMLGDSMILSEPDDTHMTVFNPDKELMDLISEISSSEGLFVWKG